MKKAKYFVWTLPSLLIATMSLMVLTLQACKVPVHIKGDQKLINVQELYTPLLVYGFILLVGAGISLYTLYQVNRISKKLKELGHPI